jgi:hypothetical protein
MNELQGAYLRRERAREHLPDLETVVTTLIKTCESGVAAYEDPETGEWGPAPWVIDPLRLRAGMLAGEVLYNLRAALDYLVYVVAASDAGTPQDGTQFLIEDTQQGFTSRSKRFLKGVSEEHIALIRQFQPYKGCEWTGILRDLSNIDKHRELASVHVDFAATAFGQITEWRITPEGEADGEPTQHDMGMYLKGPANVLLPGGRPLIETLRHLEAQVGAVLFVFSYEFPSS